MLDDRNPAIVVLEARGRPIVADRWSGPHKNTGMSAFDRAALETLDAAVLVPVGRLNDLLGFTCLGPKRSGDIYTATDRALLAAVAPQFFDQRR